MDRAQHEVTGDRGFGGDARGLRVADLTDEDDVGVGAQDRAQRAGKRDAAARVDLDLLDAVEAVLDRVLDATRCCGSGVFSSRERRVERRRLSRPGRAGHDDRALRRVERRPEAIELVGARSRVRGGP